MLERKKCCLGERTPKSDRCIKSNLENMNDTPFPLHLPPPLEPKMWVQERHVRQGMLGISFAGSLDIGFKGGEACTQA